MVDRTILYGLIEEKEILPSYILELIEFVHQNLRIKLGRQSTLTSSGVPQGLTTSLLLFDIYT